MAEKVIFKPPTRGSPFVWSDDFSSLCFVGSVYYQLGAAHKHSVACYHSKVWALPAGFQYERGFSFSSSGVHLHDSP